MKFEGTTDIHLNYDTEVYDNEEKKCSICKNPTNFWSIMWCGIPMCSTECLDTMWNNYVEASELTQNNLR